MKKIWWLIALGLIAFLLFAITTLPAGVFIEPLAKRGIIAHGVTGTVWKGAAQVVQANNVDLGSVEWNLHAIPLLTARAVADIRITRPDGFIGGELTAATGGRISMKNLNASLPLSILPPMIVPRGWSGKLNVKLVSLTIENRWPISAVGTLEILEVVGPPRQPVALGNYKLTFPENPSAEILAGVLTDTGGPMQVAGTLQMKASDRSYAINALVLTRPDASADLVNSLQYLGPPDAQGRRQIALSGTM